MKTKLSVLRTLLPFTAVLSGLCTVTSGLCGAGYSVSGVVKSPNYPNNYANNLDCTYVLATSHGALYIPSAYDGDAIKLTFSDFDLEENYDNLTITSDGFRIGRYTGSTRPPVLTLGRRLVLHFTTDFSVVAKGFSASFSTLTANCGERIVGSGLIRTPGYPNSYGINLVCVWRVVANQGKKVTLDFTSFNLENGYDFLNVYNGDTLVARYTGSQVPPKASLGPEAQLIFTSDTSIGRSGFSINAYSSGV